ncbi:sulfatase-like hydrolase/transferase [Myxococcota bacterium]|nr:sulfatase-like hydrolase/transferase [Myxococcota bacterium]
MSLTASFTRRRLLLGGVATAGLTALAAAKVAAEQGKNILLICADEHRADFLGAEGHPFAFTPRLDRLAREGVRFTQAYAAAPVCAPARASVLTGLYPPEHGQLHNNYVLHESSRTLVHAFAERGYETVCIGKLHTNTNGDYGFARRPETGMGEDHIGELRRALKRKDPPGQLVEADQAAFSRTPGGKLWGAALDDVSLVPDEAVLQESLRFLRKKHKRPFFLFSSFLQPHYPWTIPTRWYHHFDPAELPLPRSDSRALQSQPYALQRFERQGWGALTPDDHRVLLARYAGALGWLDENVGKLLDALDEEGLREDTLVVYHADHGDMASDKGLWLKSLLYDGAARIPLIARWPGVLPAGAVNDALVNQVDLLPTLAGLIGAPLREGASGQDLSATFRGERPGPDHTFCVEGARPDGVAPDALMVRGPRHKLNVYRGRFGGEAPFVELYDLQDDPFEENNRHADPALADVRAALGAVGEVFLASLRAPMHPLQTREGPIDDD